jgi:chemotaxis family two-component system response regulator PixG
MDTALCSPLARLQQDLKDLIHTKSTGTLYISHGETIVAKVYLLAGHFLYVVDTQQRMRRWRRATFQHANGWQQPTVFDNHHPWEYDFLYQGISGGKLPLEAAKSIIMSVAEECWLELALLDNLKFNWLKYERVRSTYSFFLSLSADELAPTLLRANGLYWDWYKAWGNQFSPNLSPTLTEKGQQIDNPKVKAYLTGTSSIWDIALQLHHPVTKVQKSLMAWHGKNLLIFKPLGDLSPPVEEGEEKQATETEAPTPTIAKTSSPAPAKDGTESGSSTVVPSSPTVPISVKDLDRDYLIACIDDSPIVVHNLKSILEPAGFKVLPIHEPMAGFGQLIEHKPHLILLDINMPNADGYSVCKFLHETEAFKATPIIILTARDGVVDRTRAKLAGANDFLGKPPDPQELLGKIQSYLSLGVAH